MAPSDGRGICDPAGAVAGPVVDLDPGMPDGAAHRLGAAVSLRLKRGVLGRAGNGGPGRPIREDDAARLDGPPDGAGEALELARHGA